MDLQDRIDPQSTSVVRVRLAGLAAALVISMTLGSISGGALGGCSRSSEPATFAVAQGEYERAFDAARTTLRDAQFEIERVDSALGVISTRPRAGAGIFTPWTSYQLDAASTAEDTLNQQRRRVRVSFIPVADEAAYTGKAQASRDADLDVVANRGPWTAYVEVGVSRVQTSGLRPPSKAVLMSSVATNPVEVQRGVPTIYEVPTSQDESLARALAARMRTRLGLPSSTATASPVSRADPAQNPSTQPASTQPAPVQPASTQPAPVEPPLVQPTQLVPAGELIPAPPPLDQGGQRGIPAGTIIDPAKDLRESVPLIPVPPPAPPSTPTPSLSPAPKT